MLKSTIVLLVFGIGYLYLMEAVGNFITRDLAQYEQRLTDLEQSIATSGPSNESSYKEYLARQPLKRLAQMVLDPVGVSSYTLKSVDLKDFPTDDELFYIKKQIDKFEFMLTPEEGQERILNQKSDLEQIVFNNYHRRVLIDVLAMRVPWEGISSDADAQKVGKERVKAMLLKKFADKKPDRGDDLWWQAVKLAELVQKKFGNNDFDRTCKDIIEAGFSATIGGILAFFVFMYRPGHDFSKKKVKQRRQIVEDENGLLRTATIRKPVQQKQQPTATKKSTPSQASKVSAKPSTEEELASKPKKQLHQRDKKKLRAKQEKASGKSSTPQVDPATEETSNFSSWAKKKKRQ